ncbi:MAG: urea transporter [Bacteroidetes bacterium]|nr:urea transporter [Bacteroidota bacterium]
MIFSFFKSVFRGIGQIMLQENALTGLLFLIGIFYGSAWMGFATLLAALVGTSTAYLFKFSPTEIEKGGYGFNAALVGAFGAFFLQMNVWAVFIIGVGAVLATCLHYVFIRIKIPAFTFAFVLISWALVFIVRAFFPSLALQSIAGNASTDNAFLFVVKGFGQVIFQNNLLSCVLFVLAVSISSPIASLYGLLGAALCGFLSWYFSLAAAEEITQGLMSYNAVLCAIAFSGLKTQNVWLALSAVLLSYAIQLIMLRCDMMVLTFPFVLASGLVVFLKDVWQKKNRATLF